MIEESSACFSAKGPAQYWRQVSAAGRGAFSSGVCVCMFSGRDTVRSVRLACQPYLTQRLSALPRAPKGSTAEVGLLRIHP